ncbi:MAG: nucleotide exchange factor GrpE [Myxococcales bacterium]|nr:nucleotide exchange factor GrpE [Myxococcales bacterium]USN50013.1 MAG: nucleotide exchange factor GrpE [Myxococcales bacterium]
MNENINENLDPQTGGKIMTDNKNDETQNEYLKGDINSDSQAQEASVEDKLTAELKQTHEKLLRVAAEFENYKKISQREQMNSIKFANENLVLNLLPVMDNLEQAVTAAKKSDNAKDVVIGVEMVLKQMSEVLEKFGVQFFSTHGENFDPARHEALSEREDDNVEPGTVVEQLQKGCLLNGRLLRAARVVVSKKSE